MLNQSEHFPLNIGVPRDSASRMAFGSFKKVIVSGNKIKVPLLLLRMAEEGIKRHTTVGYSRMHLYYTRPENPSTVYVP